MKLWRMEEGRVLRRNRVVAEIFMQEGKVGWRSVVPELTLYRLGFEEKPGETVEEQIVEDVKYYHGNPQLTRTVLTFRSGRKVVL